MPQRRAIVAICALLVVGCWSETGSDLLAGAERNVGQDLLPESTLEPSTEPPAESTTESTTDPAIEEQAALAAWLAYQTAVVDKNGAAAASVLSSESIDYYAGLLDATLYATAAELDQMPVVDVTTVLISRLRYDADALEVLDGRRFVELTVKDGLVDESTAVGVTFDQVEIDGPVAVLRTSNPDQELQEMEMRREAEGWKVHVVTALRELGQPLQRYAESEELSPSAASLELIRRRAPNVDAGILEPPRPRP